ncbi:hypothetical protein B0H15DRAFT_801080 [Mycena belliarum]|uniref:Uncharacterized protein n=1 Tax=Mycena belliarum TaxID=1033014 RepID=A0AAD6U5T0_9AGAR|nr:hypothetical protein B0H15DRAFT_801080 [Mycena belliae]
MYPPAMAEAREALTVVDLGPHFHAVLAAWTRIEAASRFENGPTKLSSKKRPDQVRAWIAAKRGKTGGAGVTVTDAAAYAIQWQAWWDSLQPEWRVKGVDGTWEIGGEYGERGREWGPLYQWGVNGVVSIVASLYFWGCAVKEDDRSQEVWEAAVGDVGWMLEGMAVFYEMFKGRF